MPRSQKGKEGGITLFHDLTTPSLPGYMGGGRKYTGGGVFAPPCCIGAPRPPPSGALMRSCPFSAFLSTPTHRSGSPSIRCCVATAALLGFLFKGTKDAHSAFRGGGRGVRIRNNRCLCQCLMLEAPHRKKLAAKTVSGPKDTAPRGSGPPKRSWSLPRFHGPNMPS